MVPSFEHIGHIESRAEKRVACLLAQAGLGEPSTALYSIHLPRHEYKRMAEIDFLVVLKGLLLVIEVKGGRVSRHDGLWRFRNRYGEVDEKREGPFEQARSAMFALEKDLSRRMGGLTSLFGSVVITPDQTLDSDLEWDPHEQLGPGSMTVQGIEHGLRRAARYWRSKAKTTPSGRDYDDILRVLRPDFDRVPRLSLLAGTMEEDYVRLAAQQYDMLSGAESNERILVSGGAGSGKTLLAAQTALRADHRGKSVLLTCRSPQVVDLLAAQTAGNSHVRCVRFDSFDGVEPVDVLVVDEAQDLMNVADMLALEPVVKGGLSQGTWRLFCDPNNQAHVDGPFDPQTYAELRCVASVYDLPYNCRNTGNVITQTQLITGADTGIPRVGMGPHVTYRRTNSDTSAAALLDAELKRLRQEDVHPHDVVVITMRDSSMKSAAVLSKSFAQRRLVRSPEPEDGASRLVTAREFKGLEAPHVLLVDVDDLQDRASQAQLYVGMTRPRISLWLAVSDLAWQQMGNGAGRLM